MKTRIYLTVLSTIGFLGAAEGSYASAPAGDAMTADQHSQQIQAQLAPILNPVIARLQAIYDNQNNHSYVPDLITALDAAVNTANAQLAAAAAASKDGDLRQVFNNIGLNDVSAAFAPFHVGGNGGNYANMYPKATEWIHTLNSFLQH